MAKSKLISPKVKVAIAIAFIGGVNHCSLPASSEDKELKTLSSFKFSDSNAKNEQTQKQVSRLAAYRAYRLLMRAEGYLNNEDRAQVEASFPVETPAQLYFRFRLNETLAVWGERLAAEAKKAEKSSNSDEPTPLTAATKVISRKNAGVAIATVNQALAEMDSISDEYVKLNIYFIASLLLQKAGDKHGFQKYDGVVEQYVRSCEKSESVDEQQVSAAVSVLNSKSYGILAVRLPYHLQNFPGNNLGLPEKPFTDRDIANSEAIWLRSASLADRLDATSDTRRMVHRNLSLWYKLVGKNDEAEQQKKTLFKLIGQENEKFLYPIQGICGALIWWSNPPQHSNVIGCGMG